MSFDDVIATTIAIEKREYPKINKMPTFKIQRRCTKRLYLVCRNVGKKCNFSIRCRKTSAGNIKMIQSNYSHSCLQNTCETSMKAVPVEDNKIKCPSSIRESYLPTDKDTSSTNISAISGGSVDCEDSSHSPAMPCVKEFLVEVNTSNCQPSTQDFVWHTDGTTFTDGDNTSSHISTNIGSNVCRDHASSSPAMACGKNVLVEANTNYCPATQDFVWQTDDTTTFTDGDNFSSHNSTIISRNVGPVDFSSLPETYVDSIEANNNNCPSSYSETCITKDQTFISDCCSDTDDILSNEDTGSLGDLLLSLPTVAEINFCKNQAALYKKRAALQKYVNIIISVIDSTGNQPQQLSSTLNDLLLKEFGIPFVMDLFRVSTLSERDKMIFNLQLLRDVQLPIRNMFSDNNSHRLREPLRKDFDDEDEVTYLD